MRRQLGSAGDDLAQRVDDHRQSRITQLRLRSLKTLAVVVDAWLVVKDDEMAKRRAVQCGLDSEIQILRANGEHPRFDLGDDRSKP